MIQNVYRVYCTAEDAASTDVTRWANRIIISHEPGNHYRSVKIFFSGWAPDATSAKGRWSVYVNDVPAILNGIVPPDGWSAASLTRDSGFTVCCTVYDWVWMAERICTPSTWVVGRTLSDCFKLVRSQQWHPGQWSAVTVKTMHELVSIMAHRMGVNLNIQIPDYWVQPMIINPLVTLWSSIQQLTASFYPYYYYTAETNTLHIVESINTKWSDELPAMVIPATAVVSASVSPIVNQYMRRVLVTIPEYEPDDAMKNATFVQ